MRNIRWSFCICSYFCKFSYIYSLSTSLFSAYSLRLLSYSSSCSNFVRNSLIVASYFSTSGNRHTLILSPPHVNLRYWSGLLLTPMHWTKFVRGSTKHAQLWPCCDSSSLIMKFAFSSWWLKFRFSIARAISLTLYSMFGSAPEVSIFTLRPSTTVEVVIRIRLSSI